ncbi:hypothetical protein K7957_05050 [Sphingomonas yunnanensis]|uniref:hypothetical protein n=1 Tax=Sphingomonas yunnanensis TaxID=310400 RepID=UPI001CA64B7E|nr:hypothetical protein [Sphingomonas yunnanensis]MBY9062296.1 hypothetical protein [Sphingomonas yunnanensis]
MRVVLDGGNSFDLGIVEAAPTISITDYSRRVTDDFGVTTVVERGFSRTLSVKLAVPFDEVDGLQRHLAALRATPARWIADEQIAWLGALGFFKDFELDLNYPPLSYCTLSVEGFAETETAADTGTDPAPDDATSSLRVLQPVVLTEAMLAQSSVAEADAPAWSNAATYAAGDRVMRSHVVYESAVASNKARDPLADPAAWLTVGPTNRWAMFDQALGTATTASGSIVVGLDAGTINAVALLDVVGSTVRVQAAGYDRTAAAGPGAVTFLDMPQGSGRVTVTIAGNGQVSVGTLLIGKVVGLGTTERAPTAGITDFSRKEVDDFGAVTVVPRSWAKRMGLRALLRTDAIDAVANRIASIRARPSLWIGDVGTDSLTVYGFFKDFSIEVGEVTSKLALTIEGLSEAAPISPGLGGGSVAWPDITDPLGTKPANNADKTSQNTSKDTNAVGGTPSADVLAALAAAKAQLAELNDEIIPSVDAQVAAANDRISAARGDLAAEIERAKGSEGTLNERIDSLVVDGGGYNDSALRAEVSRVDQAAITRDAAIGQRIDTVSASVGSQIDAKAQEITSAYATADKALADRQSTLEANTNDLSSRVSSAETALSDGRFATAQSVRTLEARAAPRPNLQVNGGFENGTAGLLVPQGGAVIDDAASGKRVLHWALPDESVALLPPITVQAGARYTVSFELTLSADTGGFRIDPSLWTGDNGTGSVSYDTRTSQSWLVGSSSNDPRKEFSFTAPAGTKSIQLRLIASGISNPRSIDVARVKVEAGDAPATTYTADASVTGGLAKIDQVATAIAEGGFASASTLEQLRAEYNGTAATVSTQAGAIAGLDGRTAVFWGVKGQTPEGKTSIQLSKVDGSPAQFYVGANMFVEGDLLVDGTIRSTKLDPNSMAQVGAAAWAGSVAGVVGGANVPFSLTLTPLQPRGRFMVEAIIAVQTDAGQQTVTTNYNGTGKPLTVTRVADGGGLFLRSYDDQGHVYQIDPARPFQSIPVLATTLFGTTFVATVYKGNRDTGVVNEGDYYTREIAASYVVTAINLRVTWIAI